MFDELFAGKGLLPAALLFITVYLLIMNLYGFFAMLSDKRKAVRRKMRTPERTLLTIAALGGSAGVFAGMYIFRHKTQHRKFTVGVPLLLVFNIAVVFLLLYVLSRFA